MIETIPFSNCPPLCLTTLASGTGEKANPMAEVMIWLAVIVVLAVILGMVAVAIRRKSLADSGPAIGFTLADLREMHENGEISDEEFAHAREKMLGTARAELAETDPESDPETDEEVG